MFARSSIVSLLLLAAAPAAAVESYSGEGRGSTIIDFSRGGYVDRASAAQPVSPGSAYMPASPAAAPAPAASAAVPPPRPAPAPLASGPPQAPIGAAGYVVPPNSIEGYSNPVERQRYADISAPQPLPPRFDRDAVTPAPAPTYTPNTPAPVAGKAVVRKPAAKRKVVKGDAKSQPEQAEVETPEPEKPEVPHYIAVDTSVGMTTRRQLVTSLGATAALGGKLEESGVRVHAEAQAIWSCCFGKPKDSPLPQGVQLSNAVLVGYEVVGEKGTVAGYVGVDIQNKSSGADEAPWKRTTYAGLQVSGDVYYQPTEKTMIATNASFSTHKLSYFMRTKFGVGITDDIYVGPEVGAIGSKENRQYRVGAHISGVKIGAMSFGLAAGYAYNHKAGPGAYMILDSRVVF